MTRRLGPLPRPIVVFLLAVGLSVAALAEQPSHRPLGPLPAAA
jgi:hypothetical protein